MIQLTCTHCRALLEMDDGFAGGACRCQHCGTIQTVPSHLKNKSGAKKTRTLYQNSSEPAAQSSGLDQLADIVVSSGLTSSRLRKPAAGAPESAKASSNLKPLLIGAGAIIVLLCGALIYLVTRDGKSEAPAKATAVVAQPAVVEVKKALPNFCGIRLAGDTVVYLLDRGDSTRESFGDLKSATLKSLRTLGPQKKFQILFWNNGKDEGYPRNWATFATPDNIESAREALEKIGARGKTDIKSPLTSALAADPSDIVIATGKAWDLDESFVKTVEQIRKNKTAKLHTVSLGDPGSSTALQTVASQTNGTFKTISESELKEAAR